MRVGSDESWCRRVWWMRVQYPIDSDLVPGSVDPEGPQVHGAFGDNLHVTDHAGQER
jgi:hypothetical protein